MGSLEALMNDSKASKIRDDIRQHLMASPQLENYVERFIPIYQQSPSSAKGRWAAQALLHLRWVVKISVSKLVRVVVSASTQLGQLTTSTNTRSWRPPSGPRFPTSMTISA